MADLTLHLPFEDYCAIDAINWSTLKEMHRSPLHYRHRRSTPREDTPRLALGRAIHTAVLEPVRFEDEYAVFAGGRRGTNDYKAFEAENADRTILKREDAELCMAVRDAVHAHRTAVSLLAGESEVTATWTDERTGLACKARVDHLDGECIVDLKTTSTVDEREFERTAARMLYHGQLAHYRNGIGGGPNPVIIAVEIEPPFDVAVFRLSDDAMYAGEMLVEDLLLRVSNCTAEDSWPGRYADEQELTVPEWMMPADEDAGGWGGLA